MAGFEMCRDLADLHKGFVPEQLAEQETCPEHPGGMWQDADVQLLGCLPTTVFRDCFP